MVLRNRLGLHTAEGLARAEYAYTLRRRLELEKHPVDGSFDLAHLCEIHRRLFQDVFEWAGEVRTVNIAKAQTHFLPADRIATGAAHAFGELHASRLLHSDIDDETFLNDLSRLLDDVNYLHPFREGNGRVQRAFLDQVASCSGRILTWRNVTDRENTQASAHSARTADLSPLREVLAKVVQPPDRGDAGFALDEYIVSAPNVAYDHGGSVAKCRKCGRRLEAAEQAARGFCDEHWHQRYTT